jgi:hypothetical protein
MCATNISYSLYFSMLSSQIFIFCCLSLSSHCWICLTLVTPEPSGASLPPFTRHILSLASSRPHPFYLATIFLSAPPRHRLSSEAALAQCTPAGQTSTTSQIQTTPAMMEMAVSSSRWWSARLQPPVSRSPPELPLLLHRVLVSPMGCRLHWCVLPNH